MAKKKVESSWRITDSRFVVFLDIMGFKDFVARHDHKTVYEMMKKISATKEMVETLFKSEALIPKFQNKGIYTASFSDSIILFSKDDSVESLQLLIVAARFIISDAIFESIPLKGAIAHGVMSIDKNRQIYFGQPIIDAFLLQEEVNYYGVVFHNSLDKYLNSHKINANTQALYGNFKTPMKSGNINHTNLNWFSNLNKAGVTYKENFEISMQKIKGNVSGSPRKYIDNTEEVFKLFNP